MPLQGKQLLAAVVMLVAGGAVTVVAISAVATLSCDRLEAKCRLIEGAFPSRMRTMPITSLQRADMETRRSSSRRSGRRRSFSSGSRQTYQLVLYTTGFGKVRFAQSSDNRRKIEGEMQRINAFLANPNQKTLRLTHDDRWLGILVGLFLIGVGGLSLLKPALPATKK